MTPAAQPLVLLHGWGLSSGVWAPLLAELGPTGKRHRR